MMYDDNVFPVRVMYADKSTEVIRSKEELPKGKSFTIIESRVKEEIAVEAPSAPELVDLQPAAPDLSEPASAINVDTTTKPAEV